MSLKRYRLLVSYVLLAASISAYQYDGLYSLVLFVWATAWLIGYFAAGEGERA